MAVLVRCAVVSSHGQFGTLEKFQITAEAYVQLLCRSISIPGISGGYRESLYAGDFGPLVTRLVLPPFGFAKSLRSLYLDSSVPNCR